MDNECNKNRKWYIFIGFDLGIYVGGWILILLWWLMKTVFCNKKTTTSSNAKPEDINARFKSQLDNENIKGEYVCFVALRYYIGELLSAQFLTGKIILLVSTIGAALSICLYLYEIYDTTNILERCLPLSNWVYCIDLGCNILFLCHFLLRFAASSGKIEFWIDIYTIVDLFTIPQIFLSLFIGREWYGLRFLRVVSLTKIHMVMQNFNLVKSCTSIRVINLITIFICIWIGGAGFIHLLENSGEFNFLPEYNGQEAISFGTCLYFIVVTLSTVGYGDVGAKTTFGRIFVTFFILVALAIFASFIPELAEFIFAQSSYAGRYNKESGRKHVIVCGHINFASISSFLADFFHEDRSNSNVEVVFINKQEPQEDLKGLLKSYFIQVKYFQGTVMNHEDLDRVQLNTADACLILANQNCLHPNDEDAGNIMRAISLKNYFRECPVIIQLLQFENKIYLENIPSWNRRNGDQIICYSEIELGILAQSCLVPGFSTLLTNLFSVRSEDGCQAIAGSHKDWLKDYMKGTTLEIYSAKFSPFFWNMPYKEVVGFCLKNLNLLLLAIEVTDHKKKKTLLINHLNCKKLQAHSVGYFICDSFKDAENASIYCSTCHSGVRDLNSFKKCQCKDKENFDNVKIICRENTEEFLNFNESQIDENFDAFSYIDGGKMKKSGQFYTCPSQKLAKCVISNSNQAENLKDHIILCIFSEEESPLIGIRNFLTPLRSTTIPEKELKELLIIAEQTFLEKEWPEISCFPNIKVVFHTFSIRRIKSLLAIERCSRCIILNAKTNFRDLQNDLYMVDKEIIIANLYFQATFRKSLKKRGIRKKMIESELISNQSNLIDVENKEDISLLISTPSRKDIICHIPIVSKLAIESNVQFLDVKETNASKIPNYLRKPFAFGYVFTANMLDSLLSTAYFNPNAISIMEILITGGYGCNMEGDDDDDDDDEEIADGSMNRIRIELISVNDFKNNATLENSIFYRDLFMEALEQHNTLCLGLYRKRASTQTNSNVFSTDRYVITNPPSNFPIDESDMVYCLKQINDNSKDFRCPPLCDASHL